MRKILFVAMQNSIHTTRWINQLPSDKYEVHIAPINDIELSNQIKRPVILYKPYKSISVRPSFSKLKSLLLQVIRKSKKTEKADHVVYISKLLLPNSILHALTRIFYFRFGNTEHGISKIYGPKFLSKVINKVKPDLIHSLEFQHCSYNVLFTKKNMRGLFPPWQVTNWGSDIYLYQHDPEQLKLIKEVLNNADFYSCECLRDIELAKKYGFEGKALQVFPNTGGFDILKVNLLRQRLKPSERKIILVKGYQHFAGRALNALKAIELCHQHLKDYKILVYYGQGFPEVMNMIYELKNFYGLDISVPLPLSHDRMLNLFSLARLYIGISESDAISTSMLEAISTGCFPIQTNTACCDEWIKDGESGFEVPVNDIQYIANKIIEAVSSDELVDKASDLNWETAISRLDKNLLIDKTLKMYDEIFNEIEGEN